MRLFPVTFHNDGGFIVTRARFKITIPASWVHTLNYYTIEPLHRTKGWLKNNRKQHIGSIKWRKNINSFESEVSTMVWKHHDPIIWNWVFSSPIIFHSNSVRRSYDNWITLSCHFTAKSRKQGCRDPNNHATVRHHSNKIAKCCIQIRHNFVLHRAKSASKWIIVTEIYQNIPCKI